MRYLVTGGAGFIGSHITAALVSKGHFVRVLDNFSSGKTKNLEACGKRIDLLRGDIRSPEVCLKACEGMDFVLHQAALRSVPRSMENPAEYNEVNIGGTLNMLEAALKNKVKGFVFASSSSVYGDVKSFPQKEDFTPRPISPYALTKLTGEHYCRFFSSRYGLSTVCLRYFNVFGPRQALDDEYAVVIPKFIHCLLNDEHAPIYGTGKQSRDFTYIDNVAEANLLAAKKGGRGEVFNIASGRPYTIIDLLKFLQKIMGKNIKPVFLPKRAGDVFKTHASLAQAQRKLGFRPKVDFIAGLRMTVEYFERSTG
ncbi:MAG: SDR family oxidoreductase [Candidatus Omnitrophica bacterium]|nr:SDR family oxidoreductase [Candidatus Omnitrophota bacterium]